MAILNIHIYGSPILRKKIPPMKELPENFDKMLEDMFETMYDDDGIGLSANQVGFDLRFFIADFSLREKDMGKEVFINPEIIEASGSVEGEEGCLSLPDIRENVVRAQVVKVRYETINREVKEVEFRDFPARVVQHEIDHLDGIFFIDRISPLRRNLLKSKLKRLSKAAEQGLFAKDIKKED